MKPSGSKKAKPSGGSRPLVWGLTGGVASGKSTVARLFAEAGIPVLDADALARELRAPGGAAHDLIIQRFGTADPARLREIVFADAQARRDLEGILHPLIREESTRRIAALASKGPVLYEAALLVETGRYRDFHGLIVVTADEATRLSRLISRDGCPEDLARRILASQISEDERISKAQFVIQNSGSVDDLRAQVTSLVPQLSQ